MASHAAIGSNTQKALAAKKVGLHEILERANKQKVKKLVRIGFRQRHNDFHCQNETMKRPTKKQGSKK
jgi:hypothetical protein